jgi:hypothetical protein
MMIRANPTFGGSRQTGGFNATMRLFLGSLFLCAGMFLSQDACAETPALPDHATQNLADFDFMVEKITTNYAGYDTKVTDANRAALADLTARLRAKVGTATDQELSAVLTEWSGFFHDGHTRVSGTGSAVPAETVSAVEYPQLDWTEASVRASFAKLGQHRDPLEGIWRIAGDRYRVAVLRTGTGKDAFAAVVLSTTADNWSPGQVKAKISRAEDGKFKALFRYGDHSEAPFSGQLIADGALFDLGPEFGPWTREWPVVKDPDAVDRQYPSGELFLRRISAKTLWLRIPSFDNPYATPLRTLLEAHKAELDATPNLVIDIRNNGGGSDFVYAPLSPLLYTKPIYEIGAELRASADNIALRHSLVEALKPPPEIAAQIEGQNQLMAAHLGAYVQPYERPFSIHRLDRILPFPKRVAILLDKAGSTAEQFLLEARQSHKVTLFGQRNSAGVLDFANVVSMPTPSGRFTVQWAISRSARLPNDPVDPDGIASDILIPKSERDPVTYATHWLERQVD